MFNLSQQVEFWVLIMLCVFVCATVNSFMRTSHTNRSALKVISLAQCSQKSTELVKDSQALPRSIWIDITHRALGHTYSKVHCWLEGKPYGIALFIRDQAALGKTAMAALEETPCSSCRFRKSHRLALETLQVLGHPDESQGQVQTRGVGLSNYPESRHQLAGAGLRSWKLAQEQRRSKVPWHGFHSNSKDANTVFTNSS